MKKLGLGLLLAMAMLVTAAEEKRHWDSVFVVNPDATFELDFHKGTLKLTHAAVNEITVKATYYFVDGDEGKPEYLDYLSFKTRSSADLVSIDVEYDQPSSISSGWWSNSPGYPFVEMEVIVPSGASIEIESHKGELDIEAPSGEVEIESHKGVGKIRNVRNNLEIESHKGRFDVEVTDLNDIEVETHKGDIYINVYDAANYTVVGSSHKGDLKFRGRDIRVTEEDNDIYVNHVEGSGTHKIELETHKGSITIDFRN